VLKNIEGNLLSPEERNYRCSPIPEKKSKEGRAVQITQNCVRSEEKKRKIKCGMNVIRNSSRKKRTSSSKKIHNNDPNIRKKKMGSKW